MDASAIARAYQKLSDQELVFLAKDESACLTEEALPLLRNELQNRNLLSKILEKILANQINPPAPQTAEQAVRDYAASACPSCASTLTQLNGLTLYYMKGRWIRTEWMQAFFIGCHDCLKMHYLRIRKAVITKGWKSIPGFVCCIPILLWNYRQWRKIAANQFSRSFKESIRLYTGIWEHLPQKRFIRIRTSR